MQTQDEVHCVLNLTKPRLRAVIKLLVSRVANVCSCSTLSLNIFKMAGLFLLIVSTLCIHVSLQQEFVDIVRQNFTDRLNFQLEQQITAYIRQEVTYRAYASYFERADIALPGFQKFFTSLAKTARKSGFELTELVNERGGHVTYPVIHLRDGCKSIKTELNKGDITRAVDAPIHPARREPLICYFLLLDKKDDRKETKVRKPRKDKNKPRKPKKRTKRSESWWPSFIFGANSAGEATEEQPPQSESATRIVQADSPRSVLDRSSWENGLIGLEDALALEKTVQQDLLHIIKMARKGEDRDPQVYQELREFLGTHVDSTYRVAELVKRLHRHQGLDTYDLEEYLLDQELNGG